MKSAKLGVPDHILFKPDALNEDEWESMRQTRIEL
jgi:response regulator RpfG family c-di-GMP phosphodiesterase